MHEAPGGEDRGLRAARTAFPAKPSPDSGTTSRAPDQNRHPHQRDHRPDHRPQPDAGHRTATQHTQALKRPHDAHQDQQHAETNREGALHVPSVDPPGPDVGVAR